MDSLVNEAAFLPRKLGFAPKNEDIYASDDQRKAARSDKLTRCYPFFNEILPGIFVCLWYLPKVFSQKVL